jgi:hypothetical protein
MSMKFYLFYLIISLGVIFFSCKLKDNSKMEVFEISSEDRKNKIFIKRKVWGLTDDHQITVISNSPNEIFLEPDSTTNYIYKGPQPFVYSVRGDTLIIFTMVPSTEPINFDSKGVYILQKRVSNPEYLNLLRLAISGSSEFIKI